ncbi:MAG TPA: hypothetical protein VGL86_02665 [Polyangia bacterium]|jgi:hypothetical protein
MIAVVVGTLLAAAGALAGCPAAHDDYPGTSCKSTSDCYVGEICSTAGMCMPNIDMSITGDFAHLPFGDGGNETMDLSSTSDLTSGDDL